MPLWNLFAKDNNEYSETVETPEIQELTPEQQKEHDELTQRMLEQAYENQDVIKVKERRWW